ncbi:MAG: hypothetical protein WAK82_10480 [Streptosporangiaceae bacterium]
MTDLSAGQFFRLAGGKGRELAIGRLTRTARTSSRRWTIPGGRTWGALNIEFRAEAGWQAA